MKDWEKKYDDLYLEVSLLRQAVGEYLKDPEDIYDRLDKIAPLMSDEAKKEFEKYNPFNKSNE